MSSSNGVARDFDMEQLEEKRRLLDEQLQELGQDSPHDERHADFCSMIHLQDLRTTTPPRQPQSPVERIQQRMQPNSSAWATTTTSPSMASPYQSPYRAATGSTSSLSPTPRTPEGASLQDLQVQMEHLRHFQTCLIRKKEEELQSLREQLADAHEQLKTKDGIIFNLERELESVYLEQNREATPTPDDEVSEEEDRSALQDEKVGPPFVAEDVVVVDPIVVSNCGAPFSSQMETTEDTFESATKSQAEEEFSDEGPSTDYNAIKSQAEEEYSNEEPSTNYDAIKNPGEEEFSDEVAVVPSTGYDAIKSQVEEEFSGVEVVGERSADSESIQVEKETTPSPEPRSIAAAESPIDASNLEAEKDEALSIEEKDLSQRDSTFDENHAVARSISPPLMSVKDRIAALEREREEKKMKPSPQFPFAKKTAMDQDLESEEETSANEAPLELQTSQEENLNASVDSMEEAPVKLQTSQEENLNASVEEPPIESHISQDENLHASVNSVEEPPVESQTSQDENLDSVEEAPVEFQTRQEKNLNVSYPSDGESLPMDQHVLEDSKEESENLEEEQVVANEETPVPAQEDVSFTEKVAPKELFVDDNFSDSTYDDELGLEPHSTLAQKEVSSEPALETGEFVVNVEVDQEQASEKPQFSNNVPAEQDGVLEEQEPAVEIEQVASVEDKHWPREVEAQSAEMYSNEQCAERTEETSEADNKVSLVSEAPPPHDGFSQADSHDEKVVLEEEAVDEDVVAMEDVHSYDEQNEPVDGHIDSSHEEARALEEKVTTDGDFVSSTELPEHPVPGESVPFMEEEMLEEAPFEEGLAPYLENSISLEDQEKPIDINVVPSPEEDYPEEDTSVQVNFVESMKKVPSPASVDTRSSPSSQGSPKERALSEDDYDKKEEVQAMKFSPKALERPPPKFQFERQSSQPFDCVEETNEVKGEPSALPEAAPYVLPTTTERDAHPVDHRNEPMQASAYSLQPPPTGLQGYDRTRSASAFDDPGLRDNRPVDELEIDNDTPLDVFSNEQITMTTEMVEQAPNQIARSRANKGDAGEEYAPASTDRLPNHGEGREMVRGKDILDPYGDKGKYTGVILSSTGLPHGQGFMVYQDDGRTYRGEWRHGRWHGWGHALFSNGDSFEGYYRYDQRHGQGLYKWNDGRVYEGGFFEDKRHGKGIFRWPDGAKYVGDFLAGKRHGYGAYTFSDGGHYVGNWVDGKYEGFGTCTWKDGRIYKGEWKAGMAHGKGTETYSNGRLRHSGLWFEDEPVRS